MSIPDQRERVTETNDCATINKLFMFPVIIRSAVNLGYYDDPYLKYFVSHGSERGSPEINRGIFRVNKGYAVRVLYLRNLIYNFCYKFRESCQIINIGCGFDTLYWNLEKKPKPPNFVLFDVDFESVISLKLRLIKRQRLLALNFDRLGSTYFSSKYRLLPCDIRNINHLDELLKISGFDKSKPTIVYCECILAYLEDYQIIDILKYFYGTIHQGLFVNYDPMNFDDVFGQVMQRNVKAFNYEFRAREVCKTLDTHIQKFVDTKWNGVIGYSMWDIYQNHIPLNLREKLGSIEFLDEMHLLQDLLIHYCITFGFKNLSNEEALNLAKY